MSIRCEVWSGYEAAGGVRQAIVPLVQGSLTRNVDNHDQVVLTGERSSEWAPHAGLRKILRTVDHMGGVLEWRITNVSQNRGPQEGLMDLVAESPLIDHSVLGLVRDVSTGGQSWINLGGIGITPAQYLASFVLPALARHGSSFVVIGTVDATDEIDIAWQGWTPGQLEQELATRTEKEIEYLRTSSSGYSIGLRTERGSTATTRLFRIGRNLSMLRWERKLEHLRTAIMPTGAFVPGAVEAAGIAHARWQVNAVTGGATGGTLTLADPSSGAGPVAINDQLTNLWLLRTNATLEQITSASTAHVVRLNGTTTSISTGDHIEIRASSDGTWLAELTNPAQIATYGRVVANYNDANERGEANLVANGLLGTWITSPSMHAGRASSDHTSASISLKNLTPSLAIKAGDALVDDLVADGPIAHRITADVTASTAGAAVVVLTSAITVTLDEQFYVSRQGSTTRPYGWVPDSTRTGRAGVMQKREANLTGTLSGVSDGTQDPASSNAMYKIRGLGNADRIMAGDLITVSTNAARYRIAGSVTATSSGYASVPVYRGLGPNTTDGAAVTITRPTLLTDAGVNVAVLHKMRSMEGFLESPSYTVRYDSTLPQIWMNVALTYHANSSQALLAGTTGDTPLRVILWDKNSSAEVMTVTDADRTLAANSVTNFQIQASTFLTADTKVAVRIYPPAAQVALNALADPFLYVRGVQLHLGPDPDAPFIEGSHANRLWQHGNTKLLKLSEDPDVYTVAARDLSALDGAFSSDESLTLGGTVRLQDPELDIDTNVRIMQTTHDMLDPSQVSVVLAKQPSLLTNIVGGNQAASRFFLNIDVTGTNSTSGTAGAGTGIAVSTDSNVQTSVGTVTLNSPNGMLPRQNGSVRAVQTSTTGSTGEVTRTVYRKVTL